MRALCEVASLMGPAWAGTERNVSTGTCSAELVHGVAVSLVILSWLSHCLPSDECEASGARCMAARPGPVPERQAPPSDYLIDPV
jgi:hypothetical protein